MPPPVPAVRRMSAVGSRLNPEKFLGQDFQQLHKDFCSNRARYLDSTFPPNESSIGPGLLSPEDMKKVEWIRPTVQNDERTLNLIVDGESRFDFAQGDLVVLWWWMFLVFRNCWFLCAIGAITSQSEIMDQIIPAGQSFTKDYAGIFHFRFWRFGKWIDVVIDDKLPTIDGDLIFVHCKTRNEFWPALLEKAYAKVCGSYADMGGGFVSEALELPEMWRLMYGASQYSSIMGCGTPQGETSANTVLPNGIVEGHAYTVTKVTKVIRGQKVRLVRVLNPWGRGEWVGDWKLSNANRGWVTQLTTAGCAVNSCYPLLIALVTRAK
uniref:Calpain catalytic domain-containing protein n=1 Tax=Astyanax mexicanus TaxID=7994 RepID=W5LJL4_ASTMX